MIPKLNFQLNTLFSRISARNVFRFAASYYFASRPVSVCVCFSSSRPVVAVASSTRCLCYLGSSPDSDCYWDYLLAQAQAVAVIVVFELESAFVPLASAIGVAPSPSESACAIVVVLDA